MASGLYKMTSACRFQTLLVLLSALQVIPGDLEWMKQTEKSDHNNSIKLLTNKGVFFHDKYKQSAKRETAMTSDQATELDTPFTVTILILQLTG